MKIHNERRITVGYMILDKNLFEKKLTQVSLDTKIIVRIAYRNFENS